MKPRDDNVHQIAKIIVAESGKSYTLVPMDVIVKELGPYWNDQCFRSIANEYATDKFFIYSIFIAHLMFLFQACCDGTAESLRRFLEPARCQGPPQPIKQVPLHRGWNTLVPDRCHSTDYCPCVVCHVTHIHRYVRHGTRSEYHIPRRD